MTVYDFSAKDIAGNEISFGDFEGKVLLIVNTASKCGFTPQYQGLQSLYEQYQGKGLVVLGFPCNQFGSQEQGGEQEITEFCELNFGVSFPMFSKIDVNGPDAHPLYQYLKESAKGVLGTENIKWNFTKFLVDQDGEVVDRFGSNVTPAQLEKEIKRLLA